MVRHQACDGCRRRKIKCTKEPQGCFRCLDYNVSCIYSMQQPMGRPPKLHSSLEATNDRPCLDLARSSEQSPHLGINKINTIPEDSPPESLLRDEADTFTSAMPSSQSQQQGLMAFGDGGVSLMGSIDFSGLSKLGSSVPTAPELEANFDQACCCATTFSGALEHLLNLPEGMECALHATRQASRAVYTVLQCSQCGIPPREKLLEILRPARFSLILMVVSMFPALVAAYLNVEELVDTQVIEASKNGRLISFQLGKYGGLWGPLSKENRKCQEFYDDCKVDANTWGSTVRALLRADVYGFDLSSRHEGNRLPYHHKGLWDFVQTLTLISEELQGNDMGNEVSHYLGTDPGRSGSGLQGNTHDRAEDSRSLVAATETARRWLSKLLI